LKRSDAARADREIGPIVAGLRKCSPPPALDESALTPEQRSNLRSKRLFVDRIHEVLGDDETIRTLAKFFGVARSTFFERLCERRLDLAPEDAWFKKLDDYADFQRLYAQFVTEVA
jgi:hypothetical protein